MCDISDDFERCEVWLEAEVRARKPHFCTVCHAPIHVGHVYVKHFSVFERETMTAKICALCSQARTEFVLEHNGSHTPDVFVSADLVPCIESGMHKNDSTRWRNALAGIKLRRRKYPRRSPERWAA